MVYLSLALVVFYFHPSEVCMFCGCPEPWHCCCLHSKSRSKAVVEGDRVGGKTRHEVTFDAKTLGLLLLPSISVEAEFYTAESLDLKVPLTVPVQLPLY